MRKWGHWLRMQPFTIITDQRSVAFMYSDKHASKIKNEKINRWKLELMPYKFEIIYRPGPKNHAADLLSRDTMNILTCSMGNKNDLQSLHEQWCHPGVN